MSTAPPRSTRESVLRRGGLWLSVTCSRGSPWLEAGGRERAHLPGRAAGARVPRVHRAHDVRAVPAGQVARVERAGRLGAVPAHLLEQIQKHLGGSRHGGLLVA